MNKVVDMAYKKLMVNEIVYCKMLKCNFFFLKRIIMWNLRVYALHAMLKMIVRIFSVLLSLLIDNLNT